MLEIIITSSLLILIVLALRFLLRGKLSPTVIYAMWAIVAVRLLVPVSIAETSISVMNLFEHTETVRQDYADETVYSGTTEDTQQFDVDNLPQQTTGQQIIPPADFPDAAEQRDSVSASDILLAVWLTGAAAVLAYTVISNVRFYLYLKRSRTPAFKTDCRLPLYIVEGIDSPCMFGIIRPAIYLNEFAAEDTQRAKYIITHELTHYRHLDHIWAVVRVLCIALHWFNPLVWLAAHISKQDCELACDSAAIRTLGDEHRYDYGRTLIDMINTKFRLSTAVMTSTAMTSDAKSIKRRILMLRVTPKNIIWAVVTVAVILAVAVGCTFTGANDTSADISQNTDETEETYVKSELRMENFPDLLGTQYTTYYESDYLARSYNLKLAASLIDKTILLPGEEFSFNRIVGERTEERGFVEAKLYPGEADAEQYGGGIAQTASTLYNAAFLADLEITEHFTHIYTVPYLDEFGNDASVTWGSQDLCFVNNKDYPIMIRMMYDDVALTASFFGVEDGKTAEMKILEQETVPYNVVFRPSQPEKTDTPGQLGRTVAVYRIVWQNGNQIERVREYTATYLPQNQVIYTDDLPEGFEYYIEYSRSDLQEYLNEYSYLTDEDEMNEEEGKANNPLVGMTLEEIWALPELKYLTDNVPLFEEAELKDAFECKKGVAVTYQGSYNMYGMIPELNMLVLCVRSTTVQRAEYIAELQNVGFIYTANDGSGDISQMCVLYNAPKYGVGVQVDGMGFAEGEAALEYTIIFFEQRDGCYGYMDPIPRG